MPVFGVEFDTSDLQRIIKWTTTDIDAVIADVPIWGQRAINRVGTSMLQNFRYEGTMVGGWQNLSQFTRDTRRERGFPPDHPILFQTGELERITAFTLANWKTGAKGYMPSDRDGANRMVSGWKGSQWYATVTGPKVQNQYGGQMPGYSGPNPRVTGGRAGFLPARPFFFINPSDLPKITEDAVSAFMGLWQGRGKGVKRAYGRMSVLNANTRTRRR